MNETAGRETPGPTRRTRPRDRRITILREATSAFADRGYHATSMADIAKAVGISPTALYRHFRNKQDLLAHCLLDGLDTSLERLASARDRGGSEAVLREMIATCLDLRGLPRLWQLELRNLAPEDRSAVLIRVVRLTAILRSAVRDQRPDLSPADVHLLAWCTLSVSVSPSYHRVQLPEALFAGLLDRIVEAVVGTAIPAHDRGSDVPITRRGRTDNVVDPTLRPERMISAAARLFNTNGYAAVGIEDIGAAVGVSGPALYHHFAGKADLLNEIVDRSDQWIRLYTARSMAEADTPSEALRLLLRHFVRFALREPDILGTSLSEAGHLPPEQGSRYRRAHRDGIVVWARMLMVVRPSLTLDTARIRIQALTSIVIDAVRNPLLTGRSDLESALIAIGDRVVFADTVSEITVTTA